MFGMKLTLKNYNFLSKGKLHGKNYTQLYVKIRFWKI